MGGLNGLSWKQLERVIVKHGFQFKRQKGSHRSYVKPGAKRPVVIPKHKELSPSVVSDCLEAAGITKEECLRLLGRRN